LETEDNIWSALEEVLDPEVGVNIVDLGLVYDVSMDEKGKVKIEMTLTIPECPLAEEIVAEVKKVAGQSAGVKQVEVQLVWEPKWTPARMNDKAIDEIRSRQTLH
jgi:metal-sulfur cluster biosynthetic enzyme